jgi:hypothetical protein
MDFLREISSKKNQFNRREYSSLMKKLNYKLKSSGDIDTDLEDSRIIKKDG